VRFTVPKAKSAGQAVKGVVLRVDTFGNLMTNLTTEEVPASAIESGAIKLAVAARKSESLLQHLLWEHPGAYRRNRFGRLSRDRRQPWKRRAHPRRKSRR